MSLHQKFTGYYNYDAMLHAGDMTTTMSNDNNIFKSNIDSTRH